MAKNCNSDPQYDLLPDSELDRIVNLAVWDTEYAVADIVEYGQFDETGGTLGRVDWPFD